MICVVEEPHNLLAVERTRDFRGRYHVLHGSLSPLQGVGPDELKIQGLLDRVRHGRRGGGHPGHQPHRRGRGHRGLPRPPAEAAGREVTRIAMGVPVGSDLEWADEVTMAKALEGRREY